MTVNATGWSTTPGNNTTIDSISTAENVMTVAAVNNAIRSLMAGTKEALDLMMGAKTTAGSSNAYTLTTGLGLASYAAGQGGMFKASFTNTGSATLNVDSIGAKTFNKPDAVSALTTLAAGDIVSGGIYAWAYQAGDDKIILLNPSTATLDADLVAIAAIAGTAGMLAKTAANTWALRTMTATAPVVVANGDGAAGAPALSLDITGLSADASPDSAADYVMTYDASATANKKVLLSNLVPVATLTAAAQSDQETATSTSTYVSPGRQQFHPSAPKCWAYVTVSGGTPTLAANYNITSITDTAVGRLTITIATDFSSANWAASVAIGNTTTVGVDGFGVKTQAAGSVVLYALDAGGGGDQDPDSWHFVGLGDQ